MNTVNQPNTIIITRNMNNAFGVASFIFGLISIFFMAPIFVPMAVIMGIIAIINKQLAWGITGLILAVVGFLTSPILLAAFGLITLFANHPHADQAQQPMRPSQVQLNSQSQIHEEIISQAQLRMQKWHMAGEQALKDGTECKGKRLRGEFKTYVEAANCSNSKIIDDYQVADYPRMDLIRLIAAKRLEVAEKMDSKQLTEGQGQLEFAEFVTHMVDMEQQGEQNHKQEIVPPKLTLNDKIQQAKNETSQIIQNCRNKRLSGELKSYAEAANCINQQMEDVYQGAGYPYMDLIDLIAAKRLELSEQQDKNQLTQAQAKLKFSEFVVHVNDMEKQRNHHAGN